GEITGRALDPATGQLRAYVAVPGALSEAKPSRQLRPYLGQRDRPKMCGRRFGKSSVRPVFDPAPPAGYGDKREEEPEPMAIKSGFESGSTGWSISNTSIWVIGHF